MSDIEVIVSVRRGKGKPYKGKLTITEAALEQCGEEAAKQSALQYAEKIWDASKGEKPRKLQLVKG